MEEILIVLPDDRLGGSEQVLKNISLHHLNKNDSVHVLFYKKSLTEQWADLNAYKNLKLHYTSSRSDFTGVSFAFLNLLKLKKTFDRIYTSHLHTTSFVGILIKLNFIKKKAFIGRESCSYFLRYKGIQLKIFKLLYRTGYSSLDLLICQTEIMKNQLISGLPELTKEINVQVIPNPINITFQEELRIKSINQKKTEKIDYPFVVSAGRLIWEKGFDILIEAFKKLKVDFPNFKLIILGEGNSRKELEQKIISLNLVDNVILKGHVTNVLEYFRDAEVCVVSSKIEGFPNVLLQMMSQNNRVVSTRCAGGIEELKGIVTANTNDVDDLYIKMKIALNLDVSQNRELFKKELEARSLDNFFQKIEDNLNISTI